MFFLWIAPLLAADTVEVNAPGEGTAELYGVGAADALTVEGAFGLGLAERLTLVAGWAREGVWSADPEHTPTTAWSAGLIGSLVDRDRIDVDLWADASLDGVAPGVEVNLDTPVVGLYAQGGWPWGALLGARRSLGERAELLLEHELGGASHLGLNLSWGRVESLTAVGYDGAPTLLLGVIGTFGQVERGLEVARAEPDPAPFPTLLDRPPDALRQAP